MAQPPWRMAGGQCCYSLKSLWHRARGKNDGKAVEDGVNGKGAGCCDLKGALSSHICFVKSYLLNKKVALR